MKFILGLLMFFAFGMSVVTYASDDAKTNNDETVDVVVLDLDSDSTEAVFLKFEYGMYSVFSFEIESFVYPRTLSRIAAFFGKMMKDFAHRHS